MRILDKLALWIFYPRITGGGQNMWLLCHTKQAPIQGAIFYGYSIKQQFCQGARPFQGRYAVGQPFTERKHPRKRIDIGRSTKCILWHFCLLTWLNYTFPKTQKNAPQALPRGKRSTLDRKYTRRSAEANTLLALLPSVLKQGCQGLPYGVSPIGLPLDSQYTLQTNL